MRQNWRSSLYLEFAEVLQAGAFVSTAIVVSSKRDIFLERSIKIYYFVPDLAICPVFYCVHYVDLLLSSQVRCPVVSYMIVHFQDLIFLDTLIYLTASLYL